MSAVHLHTSAAAGPRPALQRKRVPPLLQLPSISIGTGVPRTSLKGLLQCAARRQATRCRVVHDEEQLFEVRRNDVESRQMALACAQIADETKSVGEGCMPVCMARRARRQYLKP